MTFSSGMIEIDSKKVYDLGKNLFQRYKSKIDNGNLVDLLNSQDEFNLFSVLNSSTPGYSILSINSPQSSSNWAKEPIEFKLLGARILSEQKPQDVKKAKDIEAIDIKGLVDGNHYYFRDFKLSFKSLNNFHPHVQFTYQGFEYEEENEMPFEINYRAKGFPNSFLSYEPDFQFYFSRCINYFLPRNNSSTFSQDNLSQFESTLLNELKSFENSFLLNSPKIRKEDEITVVNQKLINEYKKLIDNI